MAEESIEVQVLQYKLEVIVHYLKILDGHYQVHGCDHTPEGWNLTLQEMIRLLESEDNSSAEKLREILLKCNPNHRVKSVIESPKDERD